MGDAKISPRYEIRALELEHLDWAKAIFAHSFVSSISFVFLIYDT